MKPASDTSTAPSAVREEASPSGPHRRKEEFRTWFFLTFVMAPVLAVIVVAGWGFLVWIYQLFTGPPTH